MHIFLQRGLKSERQRAWLSRKTFAGAELLGIGGREQETRRERMTKKPKCLRTILTQRLSRAGVRDRGKTKPEVPNTDRYGNKTGIYDSITLMILKGDES